jgi:hypothetical protein
MHFFKCIQQLNVTESDKKAKRSQAPDNNRAKASPGACTIKLFTAVIVAVLLLTRVIATSIHFHPSSVVISLDL